MSKEKQRGMASCSLPILENYGGCGFWLSLSSCNMAQQPPLWSLSVATAILCVHTPCIISLTTNIYENRMHQSSNYPMITTLRQARGSGEQTRTLCAGGKFGQFWLGGDDLAA